MVFKIQYSTLISNIITAVIVGWRREQAQCTPTHIAGVTWGIVRQLIIVNGVQTVLMGLCECKYCHHWQQILICYV